MRRAVAGPFGARPHVFQGLFSPSLPGARVLDQRDKLLRRPAGKLLEQRFGELSLAGPETAGLHLPKPSHRELFNLSRNAYKPGDLSAINRSSSASRSNLGPRRANGLGRLGGHRSRWCGRHINFGSGDASCRGATNWRSTTWTGLSLTTKLRDYVRGGSG